MVQPYTAPPLPLHSLPDSRLPRKLLLESQSHSEKELHGKGEAPVGDVLVDLKRKFWGSVPTRALIMISERYTSSLRFGRSSSCWRFRTYNLVGVIISYVLFVEPRDLLCSFWWLLSPF